MKYFFILIKEVFWIRTSSHVHGDRIRTKKTSECDSDPKHFKTISVLPRSFTKKLSEIIYSNCLGRLVTRASLGLPEDWETVEDWCKKLFQFGFPISSHQRKKDSKWANLDYSKKAPKEFWDKFPSRPLPQQPTTRVKVSKLKAAIDKAAGQWTVHQVEVAARTVKNLEEGAPSYTS